MRAGYYKKDTWILIIDYSNKPRYKITNSEHTIRPWTPVFNISKFIKDVYESEYIEVSEAEAMLELL
jgi:hypothetical protein